MKRLGISLLVLAWAGCAQAAPSASETKPPITNYWYLGAEPSDHSLEYADADSVTRTPAGTIVTIYDLYTGPESALADNLKLLSLLSGTALPRNVRLMVVTARFDCSKHTMEIVDGAMYDSHGALIESSSSRKLQPFPVDAGTAVVEAFACNDASYWEQHFRRAQAGEASDLARPGFQPPAP